MKKFYTMFLLSCVAFLLLPVVALAETGPTQLIENVFQQMKATGNASPLLSVIHWKTAFKKLDAESKAQMHVKSASELKTVYSKIISNPTEYVLSQMKNQMKNMPAEQQSMMNQQISSMKTRMAAFQEKQKKELQGTTVKVTDEKITGDTATVKIVSSFNGKTKSDEVHLIRVDNKWYVPSFDDLGSKESKMKMMQ